MTFLTALLVLPLTSFALTHATFASSPSSSSDLLTPLGDREKEDGFKLVCYYGSWAHWRPTIGRLSSDDIDPFMCTHVIYSFLKINPNFTVTSNDAHLDLEGETRVGSYRKFLALRDKNPALKVMISVGGWNEGSQIFSNMSLTAESRKTFISSVLLFLDKYPFDGLDVDWEYPSQRDGRKEDRQNFLSLLKELRTAFDQRDKKLLLSAAVAATKYIADKSYEIPVLSQLLSFVNIMSYDYFGPWTYVVGHNAPLFHRPQEKFENSDLSVNASIMYWIRNGMDHRKILMGIPMYGRTFTLRNASDHYPFAISDGEGIRGNFTQIPGTVSYYEACQLAEQEGTKQFWAKDWQAPFLVQGDQWISYENARSVKAKADYIRTHRLAGAMVWSIDHDDVSAVCGAGRMPLSYVIRETLQIRFPDSISSSKNKQQPVSNGSRANEKASGKETKTEAVADSVNFGARPRTKGVTRLIVTSGSTQSHALPILLITLVNSTYLLRNG